MKTTIKNLSAVIAGLYAEKVAAEQIAVELHDELEALKLAAIQPKPSSTELDDLRRALVKCNTDFDGLHHIAGLMGGPNEVCQILADNSPTELSPEQITLIHEVFGGAGEPEAAENPATGRYDLAAQRLAEIRMLRAALDERDAETKRLAGQLKESSNLLTNRCDQIVELQTTLADRDTQLREAIEQLASRRGTIAQRDSLIDNLRQLLHGQGARSYDQIESLNSQLKTLQANYNMLEQDKKRALEALDAKSEKADELVREKVALKRRMAEAARALEEAKNSISRAHLETVIENIIKELRK